MDEHKTKIDIIESLFREEAAENNLISLYLSLLELGLENCIAQSERENFRREMDILYSESIEHKEIILNILKKYL